mmetsp:Transcript_59952/g.164929  ORF Transcript_59952/g.164929 Transcript_59952/m.164929 type:complete len:306 (-) Transcript_59952:117-1034(-)
MAEFTFFRNPASASLPAPPLSVGFAGPSSLVPPPPSSPQRASGEAPVETLDAASSSAPVPPPPSLPPRPYKKPEERHTHASIQNRRGRRAPKKAGDGCSRAMPDSAFAQAYQRPCFHNYGRSNTNPSVGGVVADDYMLTHNVNPQTLPNQPGRNQVHRSVVSNLKYSKPARKVFRATPPMSTRQGSPVRSTTRILAPALVVDGADAPMSHPPSAEAGFAVGPGTPGGEALPASAPETDPMVMPSESAFAYRPFSDEPLPSAVSQQLDNNPKSYKKLAPEFTRMIVPAGHRNIKGISVAQCLDIFD